MAELIQSGTEAGKLLRYVADIVEGVRNQTHGNKERSFNDIAQAWSQEIGAPLKGSDVALLMVRLKEKRMAHGDPNAWKEHVEDILGYWSIYHELRLAERIDTLERS